MEELDVDELEWMACQGFAQEEDDRCYFDDMAPEVNDEAGLRSHEDRYRKRLWQDECLPSEESSGAKKLHRLMSDPLGNFSKKSLSIPALTSEASSENQLRTLFSQATALECDHAQGRRDLFTATSAEKPWSSPPPTAMEEARPMSPPRDQEGESVKEMEPSSQYKLPHRRAADIEGEYVSVTGVNGDRVYAAKVGPVKLSHNASTVYSTGLLAEPIAKMIDRLEREMFEQVIAACDKNSRLGGETDAESAPQHEDLWVEKYAPRSFTELLSDEQTNREVLRWLKQWDSCVFGSKKRSTSEEVLTSLRRQVTQIRGRGSARGRESSNHTSRNTLSRSDKLDGDSVRNIATEASNLDRPEEKVLLLCGPPGLGKTTLAHVAARHCGYRVVEINASDDRVATTLQGKILDAIQMQSVMGDSRPNCLVIDEIDGALSGAEGKGAIDALLEIINAEKKVLPGKENDEEEGFVRKNTRKKGAAAVRRLSRPVICICNDLYAPALRNLRQVARVHVFVESSISRVVSRLKYICGKEGYKTSARALSALASHTDCDIRSCLNTLQFLNRKKQNLKTLDVGSQVIGRKDMTSSIFDIWGEVFHRRKARPGNVMHGMVEMPECGNQDHKDFVRLYGLFSNHGDFDLSLDGVHENFLHMRYLDASLNKTVKALEWMGDSEIFNHHVMAKQQFHLLAYQPLMMIAIRGLVAQQERPQVNWPRSHQNCRTEKAVKKEMLCSWLVAMTASISRTLSHSCLALDMISPLLSILTSPTIRPVASQLLTPKEKDEVAQLVDTMLGFGISYKHPKPGLVKAEYGMEGHNAPVLDPPIDTLIRYKDYAIGYRRLSSALCQILSHEQSGMCLSEQLGIISLLHSKVDIERIRREGAARERKMGATSPKLKPSVEASIQEDKGVNKPPHSKAETQSNVSNVAAGFSNKGRDPQSVQESKPGQQDIPQHHRPMNFFERFKKSAQSGVTADVKAKERLATLQRDSRPLLYRFHEGFTNAVKRPMLVRDFL